VNWSQLRPQQKSIGLFQLVPFQCTLYMEQPHDRYYIASFFSRNYFRRAEGVLDWAKIIKVFIYLQMYCITGSLVIISYSLSTPLPNGTDKTFSSCSSEVSYRVVMYLSIKEHCYADARRRQFCTRGSPKCRK
jgi:hypothetical protein